jgi:hypothetical protein
VTIDGVRKPIDMANRKLVAVTSGRTKSVQPYQKMLDELVLGARVILSVSRLSPG